MQSDARDPRLGRRVLMLRLASGAGAAAVLAAGAEAGPPEQAATAVPLVPTPVRTDNDPRDAAGYGRGGGRTDNDPRDAAGRGYGYAAPQQRQVSDNDPRDAAGYGRGYAPPRRSVTDNDPRDAAGGGRGWR